MENPELAEPGWQPHIVDYIYVSFTNSIAFSPTDAMPLTRRVEAAHAGRVVDLGGHDPARRGALDQHPRLAAVVQARSMRQLWAPWRLEYIRSADEQDGCVLCRAAAAGDAEGLVVHRGEHAFVAREQVPVRVGPPDGRAVPPRGRAAAT